MAKTSFKDMIFKLLKKDEDNQMGFVVRFAKSKGGKISTAYYRSRSDAEKALEAFHLAWILASIFLNWYSVVIILIVSHLTHG